MRTRSCAGSPAPGRNGLLALARSRPVAQACDMSDIGVLISGRGSNLQALIDAVADHRLDARIAVVISNKPEAEGLERARAAGIEAVVMNHRAYLSRDAYDAALADLLQAKNVSLVCLAGFMRLIGPT